MSTPDFLAVTRAESRLILSIPHAGTDLPDDIRPHYVSDWQARADADWWLDRLYDFAASQDITIVKTGMSRSVIDVNRDPSGASLYPGMTTTGLCPTEDFDGLPLYKPDCAPGDAEIARRIERYFVPYHVTLVSEIARLRERHNHIVLFDAHSIRSRIPRLFEGVLPICNLGSNDGRSADETLLNALSGLCAASGFDHVVNGRFKGGYITRHYGDPAQGVHAVQLELACRGYIDEPDGAIDPANWPPPFHQQRAAAIQSLLHALLDTCRSRPIGH